MSGGDKLRVSQHSGRSGSAKHNDRSFLTGRSTEWRQEHAPHIDTERTADNVVWTWDGQTEVEASERAWYAEAYQQAQEATNDRYRREGHTDRCKTTDQLYEGRLTRPEELILQVGKQTDGIAPEDLAQAVDRYLDRLDAWDVAHGGHMHILSIALHVDESSPHLHIRRVWDYTDRDGLTRLGQARALEAAGVPLPDPSKPAGRYNNRKMSFDALSRGWWQEACREQGWEIETEARPDMRHKSKQDYIRDQMAAEIDGLTAEADRSRQEAATARQEATAADRIRQDATRQAQEARQQAQETEKQLSTARQELEAIEERTRTLTAAEVERMAQSHKGFLGLRLVRADDWNRVMDTARQAEDATRRADAIEAERDGIIQQAQEQAQELTRQATQERDKARKQRDVLRAERDALAKESERLAVTTKAAQEMLPEYEEVRGGILATKLIGLLSYSPRPKHLTTDPQPGRLIASVDKALDSAIKQIPRDLMPEPLQELQRATEQLETHARAVKDLTDDLEL